MTTRRDILGFSLVELMITVTILAVVLAAVTVILIGSQHSKANTEALLETQQTARTVLEFMSNDVRSAGYGTDEDAVPPQPAFAYVDSVELILYANLQPRVPGNSAPVSTTLPPLALEPTGNPLPFPVNGTAWQPPMKFGTGAEMVRYTLDLNNDGAVDASDQAHVAAHEAVRSANPSDYVLARMVYGDSSGTVPTAGNNGGAVEKLGLVILPGGTVPPLFTVYLGSNPTAWNWANGPIPASRLDEISRVVLNVTTESRRPDKDGTYVRTTMSSEVNSIRNVPEAGYTTFSVDGYVFDDLDENGVRDAGEPGLRDVVVRLGTAATGYTNTAGYYLMTVAPGSYTLKQEVPEGYGAFSPDSVLVDLISSPADFTHDFADTSVVGGWIQDSVWVDTNGDLDWDADEYAMDGVAITVAGVTHYTDGIGFTQHFVSPGGWSVAATAPDSFVVTSTNPVPVVMVDGDTVTVHFALGPSGTGFVEGTVFVDTDRDQVKDATESGMAGVWVGVTKDAGAAVLGFAYTDASGNYSISVPNNMPDATIPYEVTLQVPAGYYTTGSSVIGPIWVADGATVSGNNFGLQSFQVITLNAERVLSLASAELMEKDWSGSDAQSQYLSKGHQDPDLILGSEYSSNPNISIWFNNWNSTPYFDATATYQVNAWSSALSIAAGPVDSDSPWYRPDVVTGLESYASGNIAVWLTQNTSGNYGYLPATPTYLNTLDGGNVNTVLLHDVDGDGDLDLVAGTKSYADAGSFEVWRNAAGVFTRAYTFPPVGGISFLGEVRSMALGNFDGDAVKDLALVTKTSDGNGTLHLLIGTLTPPYYFYYDEKDLTGEGNAVVVLDANGDAMDDIFVGTRKNTTQGLIEHWGRASAAPFDFSLVRKFAAPGVVLSLAAGDFGGLATRSDVAFGYQTAEGSYVGGVQILLLDGGTFPVAGLDPSGGAAAYMVPALNANNFNTGANPSPSGTALTDLGAAMKSGATTGAVLIFLR